MDLQYTAVFEQLSQEDGGGYLAYCEELPGAITQGETIDEARDNLKDAISLLLESYRDDVVHRDHGGVRIVREKITVPAA
ncbi:MAG TPA: type II toxin-antitoxin system HicB family antitoxin [Terriglobales bacterium]|nr:type II toxin-antitoxin system HicB family antitoxin [Terriglobales bacterium]